MSAFPTVYIVASNPDQFAELAGAARELGGSIVAVNVGDARSAAGVFGFGAEKLLNLAAEPGHVFENCAVSIAAAIRQNGGPALVLLVADRRGRAMAAKLGVALDACVINDVNGAGDGVFRHLVYGGLAEGIEKPLTGIVVATIAPGAFGLAAAGEGQGETTEIDYVAPKAAITRRETKPREISSVNIGKARRLVGVGRGFGKKEDLELARALAGIINAELACSRPIAEGERWMEKERYVGVSGVTVKPDVYFAIGISGQIQHLVGARESRVIIAINRDRNAPIFRAADYGLVGDLYKILPALSRALG